MRDSLLTCFHILFLYSGWCIVVVPGSILTRRRQPRTREIQSQCYSDILEVFIWYC